MSTDVRLPAAPDIYPLTEMLTIHLHPLHPKSPFSVIFFTFLGHPFNVIVTFLLCLVAASLLPYVHPVPPPPPPPPTRCTLLFPCVEFEVKLFEDPNGATDNENDYPIRLVLSSFYWQGDSKGVPDGLSDCTLCTAECDACRSTEYWSAYDAASCGYDDTYTRPHRDLAIVNAMREWMHLESTSYAALGLPGC